MKSSGKFKSHPVSPFHYEPECVNLKFTKYSWIPYLVSPTIHIEISNGPGVNLKFTKYSWIPYLVCSTIHIDISNCAGASIFHLMWTAPTTADGQTHNSTIQLLSIIWYYNENISLHTTAQLNLDFNTYLLSGQTFAWHIYTRIGKHRECYRYLQHSGWIGRLHTFIQEYYSVSLRSSDQSREPVNGWYVCMQILL